MKWFILILGIASSASASVLVEMVMMSPRKFPSLNEPMAAKSNWPFWSGLIRDVAAFLLYAGALARLPLNVAQRVLTAGAVATVTLCSVVIFREPFHWTTAAGIVLVIVGVALVKARVA